MTRRHIQPVAGGCLRCGLGRRLASLSLALFLVLSVTSGLGHAAPGPTDLVATGFGPATDGTTAVWFSPNDEPGIYAARAPEWHPFLVYRIPPGMGISKVLVAGDVVVWQQYDGVNAPDIRGKHLVTGHEFDVAVTPAYEGLDDLSGSMVLWHEWMAADGGVLKARDVATSAPPMTIRTVPAGSVIAAAAISGDRVAWVEATQDEHYGVLKVATLGHDPVTISETTESRFRGLDLNGDLLIYYGSTGRVVVHDLATGQSRSLDMAPRGQRPTANGRYVFWDTSTCNGWRCQIMSFAGYDLQTDSSFVVSTNGALQELVLQTRGDTVVWGQGGGVWGPGGPEPSPSFDLHVANIEEVLPTGARPAPGASSPDWFYLHES